MPLTAEGQASRLILDLESAVDAIISINGAGNIETVNPAAERLFGYSRDEFLGRNVRFLMPEPYHDEHDSYIANYVATGRRKIIGIGRQVIGRRSDGSTFPMHLSVSEFHIGGERHFTGIIHDMTEQTNAEQALRQAQKMEALGQLTGGIAHDFNNLLTVIVGNLEMLEAKLADASQLSLLREAQEAADLGSRLTARLLTFARRACSSPSSSTSTPSSSASPTWCSGRWGKPSPSAPRSAVISGIPASIPRRWKAPSSIWRSMPATPCRTAGGCWSRLQMSTSTRPMPPWRPDCSRADYVRLSVSDDGSGMSAAVRERAFDPFFTTKEKGRGTGLGLAMVYGFAQQSGGHATLYSEEGMGTTVRIYLPRHYLPASGEASTELPDEPLRGSGQLVLVVEDDPRVHRLTIARLGDLGYRVLDATNGTDALAVLSASTGIDLVFTDLVMPDMSGYELAARVRELYPNIRLLLTSGYAEEFASADKLFSDSLPLLRKPYRLAELAKAVYRALSAE